MNIRVKLLQGDEYIINVSNDQLVSQLKACISERANGLPIERQRLVYKGRTLQDKNQISEYNLEDGCKVHLILQKEGSSNLDHATASQSSSAGTTSCPMNVSPTSNQAQTNTDNPHPRPVAATSSLTTTATDLEQTANSDSARNRPLSSFEIILRERLGRHFSSPAVEKIMASLHREIDADINSSSLDDLERLAKQKLNISNE